MGSEGADFTTPTSMSGATSPAASRNRQDCAGEDGGACQRQHDSEQRFRAGCAESQAPLPDRAWYSAQALLSGYDHDRHREQRSVSEAQKIPGVPKVAAGRAALEKQAVQITADEVHEEAEPKTP